MPKLKTKKSLLKRLKITARHKFLKRAIHQNHFKSKESGQETIARHRTKNVSEPDAKTFKKLLPYI